MSVVVVLGLLSVGNASPPRATEAVSVWSLGELAEQYRGADREDAIATVVLWTQREVEAETEGLLKAVKAVARAEDATQEEIAQGEVRLLAAAGLLSDAAMWARRRFNPRRTRRDLQAAACLVRATRPTGAGFTRRFYLVGGLMLHETGDLAGAYEMLSEGRRHAEDDAELLLALGAVSETVATLRHYERPKGARGRRNARAAPRFVIEGEAGAGGVLPHASLGDAEALYRKALQQDSGLLEARIRLGRVLLLRGKPREALVELERVGPGASRPAQYYMTRLFEGRTRERLGDLRGAASAFSAAAERMPHAQSALVALGRALDRLGEGARAQEMFDRAMQKETGARIDPWLNYIRGQPDRVEGLLEELRRLVR